MKWTEIRPRVFQAEDGTLQDGTAAHPWRDVTGDQVVYLAIGEAPKVCPTCGGATTERRFNLRDKWTWNCAGGCNP